MFRKFRSFRRQLSPAKIFFVFNLIIIVVIFILGFRPNAFQKTINSQDLAFYNKHFITLDGRVCEEADVDVKSRRLTICVKAVLNNQEINGQVLVSTNMYPVYDYGDFVRISGELQAPPEIDNFDYASYLARYDIYSVMYYPKIIKISGNLTRPQVIYRLLINFKQKLKSLIDSTLPEPEAGLADALLLGYRRTVDRADLDIFARVGLSHMIAISGSHITILSAMIINFFLAFGISRRHAFIIIFIFLFLYPLITGLAASAVRSAIMGGLSFLAIYYGRNSSLIKALVFSAALMLIINPQLLQNDIGFQLSFLAILGIIYIYPLGDNLINKILIKARFKIKTKNFIKIILETINLTLVAQVVILPVALINFKQLSLIAPLANVLVIWTFPPLLASLIIGLVLSAVFPILNVIWFAPAYFLLKFIFITSSLLALPNWAALAWTRFNWYQGAIYYFCWILFIYFLSSKRRRRYKKSLNNLLKEP